MRLFKITFFLYLYTAMASVSAQVMLHQDMDLEQLSGQAELVFQGTVQDIKYKASVDGIPHTFVTYDVEDVIQGSYNKPQITLRFVGGFMEKNGKTIQLSVSHAPQIAQGEQGVMMVQGNASVQCPLVGCSFGRFEFVDGHVADAGGQMMAMGANGNVERVRNLMHLKAEEGGDDLQSKASLQQGMETRSALMDTHTFVAHLRSIANKTGSAKGFRANRVRSANPTKPFKGPKVQVGPPPSSNNSAQASVAQQGSDFDRWEVEQLRKNGGNPIMKNQYSASKGSAALDSGKK